jgi:hypothetical protein
MNSPMLLVLLLKMVEIIKSTIISRKFMDAIIEPIIVSQFFVDRGSFILVRFSAVQGKNKKILYSASE